MSAFIKSSILLKKIVRRYKNQIKTKQYRSPYEATYPQVRRVENPNVTKCPSLEDCAGAKGGR